MSNTRKLPRGTRYIDDGAGCLIRLPATEEEVWKWVDGVGADTRLDGDTKYYAATIAARMIQALRHGVGVIRR